MPSIRKIISSRRNGEMAMARPLRDAEPELQLPALLGELARPFMHECNNFLNNLFLQMAVAPENSPEAQADVASLLQRGKRLASLAAQWQQFGKPACRVESVRLDTIIHGVVREVTRDWPGAAPVSLDLGADPLSVWGAEGDVARLCYFALANASMATARLVTPGHEKAFASAKCCPAY